MNFALAKLYLPMFSKIQKRIVILLILSVFNIPKSFFMDPIEQRFHRYTWTGNYIPTRRYMIKNAGKKQLF